MLNRFVLLSQPGKTYFSFKVDANGGGRDLLSPNWPPSKSKGRTNDLRAIEGDEKVGQMIFWDTLFFIRRWSRGDV